MKHTKMGGNINIFGSDYITRSEFSLAMTRIDDRFDEMERKIDLKMDEKVEEFKRYAGSLNEEFRGHVKGLAQITNSNLNDILDVKERILRLEEIIKYQPKPIF